MKRVRTIKLNLAPEPCGGRKPADQVTDRALRYRANSEGCKPDGPLRCLWCGAKEAENATAKRPGVEVAHIDGNESNTAPENLAWTCRSCNQKVAAVMKRAGVGRPTNQYNGRILLEKGVTTRKEAGFYAKASRDMGYSNVKVDKRGASWVITADPIKKGHVAGARTQEQYAWALAVMRGDEDGDAAEAAQIVLDTPHSRRSEWNKEFWRIRKQRYGPSGRKDGGAVPF